MFLSLILLLSFAHACRSQVDSLSSLKTCLGPSLLNYLVTPDHSFLGQTTSQSSFQWLQTGTIHIKFNIYTNNLFYNTGYRNRISKIPLAIFMVQDLSQVSIAGFKFKYCELILYN